ncbi:hypothetical protein LINPERHAP2_LOCUS37260 [Linum perenne]
MSNYSAYGLGKKLDFSWARTGSSIAAVVLGDNALTEKEFA